MSYQALLASKLAQLIEQLSAERGCIMTSSGTVIALPEGGDFPFSRRVVDSVLDRGQPLVTADAVTDDAVPQSMSLLMKGIRSVLCCPIQLEEDKEALVYIDSSMQARRFSENDLKLVQDSFAR